MIVLVSRMDSVVSLCSGSEARLDLRVLHWQAMGASYLLRKTFVAAVGLINKLAVRKCCTAEQPRKAPRGEKLCCLTQPNALPRLPG